VWEASQEFGRVIAIYWMDESGAPIVLVGGEKDEREGIKRGKENLERWYKMLVKSTFYEQEVDIGNARNTAKWSS
jgi:hypothetical protein